MTNLVKFSNQIRIETSKMLLNRGFGHLGGSFSITETLSVLYGVIMKIDPKNPKWEERDYFVLSKGHAGPALYATLALKGYFPLDWLNTLNNDGTRLPSHPDRILTPGIDCTTGSLGQGISQAVGIAKAFQMDNKPNRVYSIVGDGELNEGQVWEAFQFAAHHKLNNLIIFIDENHKQLDGYTTEIMNPFDIRQKMEAFGFNAIRIDGSDIDVIKSTIENCIESKEPCAIVLDTVKGQGVEYFEQLYSNHHIRFDEESKTELLKAIERLEKEVEEME